MRLLLLFAGGALLGAGGLLIVLYRLLDRTLGLPGTWTPERP
jgi:hypothetical protein